MSEGPCTAGPTLIDLSVDEEEYLQGHHRLSGAVRVFIDT